MTIVLGILVTVMGVGALLFPYIIGGTVVDKLQKEVLHKYRKRFFACDYAVSMSAAYITAFGLFLLMTSNEEIKNLLGVMILGLIGLLGFGISVFLFLRTLKKAKSEQPPIEEKEIEVDLSENL